MGLVVRFDMSQLTSSHNCVERFDETNVIGEPNIFEKLILFIENIEYTRDENYAIMTHRFEKISNNQQDEIDPR
jgi:hypothetical protein